MTKFSNFPVTLILRGINFRRSKPAISIILEALNFDFGKNVPLEMSKVSKNTKFIAAQMVKMAVFGASK